MNKKEFYKYHNEWRKTSKLKHKKKEHIYVNDRIYADKMNLYDLAEMLHDLLDFDERDPHGVSVKGMKIVNTIFSNLVKQIKENGEVELPHIGRLCKTRYRKRVNDSFNTPDRYIDRSIPVDKCIVKLRVGPSLLRALLLDNFDYAN